MHAEYWLIYSFVLYSYYFTYLFILDSFTLRHLERRTKTINSFRWPTLHRFEQDTNLRLLYLMLLSRSTSVTKLWKNERESALSDHIFLWYHFMFHSILGSGANGNPQLTLLYISPFIHVCNATHASSLYTIAYVDLIPRPFCAILCLHGNLIFVPFLCHFLVPFLWWLMSNV